MDHLRGRRSVVLVSAATTAASRIFGRRLGRDPQLRHLPHAHPGDVPDLREHCRGGGADRCDRAACCSAAPSCRKWSTAVSRYPPRGGSAPGGSPRPARWSRNRPPPGPARSIGTCPGSTRFWPVQVPSRRWWPARMHYPGVPSRSRSRDPLRQRQSHRSPLPRGAADRRGRDGVLLGCGEGVLATRRRVLDRRRVRRWLHPQSHVRRGVLGPDRSHRGRARRLRSRR